MKEFSKKVLEIVKEHNGIKASEIAKILNCERSEVNSALYSATELKNYCWQDSRYLWFSNEVKKEDKTTKHIEIKYDTKLNSICSYYLNCLNIEQNTGISTFLTSKFDPLYIEIAGLNKEDIYTDSVATYLFKNNKMKKSANFLGYPILIDKFTSKNGEIYYKEYPIFLFNITYETGNITIDTLPTINTDVLKKYSTNGSKDIIYDQLQLEEELGLNNEYLDIQIDELIARLQDIRLWDWKEKMNPNNIDISVPMETITAPGIYNRAIILSTEKSPYTIGLESELLELSKKSKDDYKGTALYNWINDETNINSKSNNNNILEVLPLNSEQYQAVDMSLAQDMTIITGPPGTGKSQVVTNILANMAVQNKNVLFTSKNNKAVDVVYNRVNGLSNKPVMLRVGGIAFAHELSNLIENILSAYTDDNAIEDYKFYKKNYDNIITDRNKLLDEKSEIISLRNKIDKLEQKVCTLNQNIREKYNNISNEYILNLLEEYKKYKRTYYYADKNSQDIFTRFFWKWKKEKRENALVEVANNFNEQIKCFELTIFDHVVNIQLFQEKNKQIFSLLEDLKILLEYKENLQLLNSKKTLEGLDIEIREQNFKLKDIALKVWDGWLSTRTNDISSSDRSKMTSYISAIKLIGETDVNNYPNIQHQFKELQKSMTKYLPCWSVTSLSVKGRIPFIKAMFDLLIIDEASQCDIASILPLLYRAKRVAVIGDPKQLSHISSISKSQDISMIKKYNIDMKWSYSSSSLYDLASGLVDSKEIIHLRDHHRSFGDIIEFSNREFYEGKLRVATNYSKLKTSHNLNPGIRWIDVVGTVTKPTSGSAYNLKEAQKIIEELQHLMDNNYHGSIGIVTPFRAQAEKIRELIFQNDELYKKLLNLNDSKSEPFLVDTVHKFQGDERDIILFSPVISNNAQNGAISFLNKTGNLFNVAITRARSHLLVIGDKKYCSTCPVKYMNNFAYYYEELQNKKIKASTKTIYGQTREYPYVENNEHVSNWEREFYSALFDAGIQTIPQFPEDKYKLDLAIIIGNNKLDIEIDGELYHRDWNGELCYRDQLRNQRLYELGWDIKRFWVYQIRDELDKCINEVKKWVEEHKVINE